MRIKLTSIVCGLAIISSSVVYAQMPSKEGGDDHGFSDRKAQMLKNLNEQKSGIEQVIGCVNSAKNHDDMKKCNELRKANIDKMHDLKRAERKEHLQKELKKIDEEAKDSKK